MPAAALPRDARSAPRTPSSGSVRARSGPRRALRVLLVLAVLAGVLAAAYLLWFRDSELVRIERTTVSGATTEDADEIRRSLVDAASGMTTLRVDTARLERSVARFPEVAGLKVEPAFPHELKVHVVERRPIATVPGPGEEQLAVASDGTVLPDAEPGRPLPALPAPPASAASAVDHPRALAALETVAAAPPALVGKIATVRHNPRDGLVVELREGPPLVFGDGERLESKWIAASSVLARGAAAGAAYVDLSLPERPAVGG